jgi:hypothetical protein
MGDSFVGCIIKTPILKKETVCINLETPEVGVHKCSGCDIMNAADKDYSISPEICIAKTGDALRSEKVKFPAVPYIEDDNGFDDNVCEHEDFTCVQCTGRNRSYDGMTDSEDSRLCYGLSGKRITDYDII